MISFELLAFSRFLAVSAAYFRPHLAKERLSTASCKPWRNRSRNGSFDIGGNPSRNPFGNPSLQASRVSGFGRRPSYRQSRIHGHEIGARYNPLQNFNLKFEGLHPL